MMSLLVCRGASTIAATISIRAGLILISSASIVEVARAAVVLPTGFSNEVVVSGLLQPTGLALLPDGRLLFTEQRTGRVRMVVNGHLAATDPVLTVPYLQNIGYERGLTGIAVDTRWPEHPYVYLFYTRTGDKLRLVRYQASGDVSHPAGEVLSLGDPFVIFDDLPDDAPTHNGGTLRFGPDDHLYVSLGDDANQCAGQDSTLLRGQILRLDIRSLPPGPGGPVLRAEVTPADNPLSSPDSNARLVYAYGMRNPFRFHIDPVTGKLYVGDVGEQRWEELNEVDAGDNLGWPNREALTIRIIIWCLEPGGPGAVSYTDPIAWYDHSQGVAAVISAGIYRPTLGPGAWSREYNGNVFFADYYSGFLRRLVNFNGVWLPAVPAFGQRTVLDWATGLTCPVDFAFDDDNTLWWLSQYDGSFSGPTGTLQRIRYTDTGILDVPPSPSTGVLRAAPTPFALETSFSAELPSSGSIRLAVYDVGGREVRRLAEGPTPAGSLRVSWDGRDAAGNSVPAGIYLVRLDHAGGHEVARVLRLR